MRTQAPEKHGFDPTRLKRLDAHLADKFVASGKLAHAQVLISRHGEIVHFNSFGTARDGSSARIDERSIFRIASMTKPITSIAFMMLVEEGKVAVDTPVHHVLTEFADIGVFAGGGGAAPFASKPAAEPMRMLDLLRHTSGLTYGFQNRTPIDAAYRAGKIEDWHGEYDLDGFVGALAKLPLEFSPGEAWNYGVSTDVLGAVVQRVSGVPLDRYLTEKIFKPLKMHDTTFAVPADKAERLTDCHMWDVQSGKRFMYDRAVESLWLRQPKLLSGGAGLVSTALDYHRFCLMLANGGELDGARLIGRKTLDLMTANHLPGGADLSTTSRSLFSETQNAGIGFGLGFAVTQDPAKAMIPGTPGEFYWGGMFSTSFFIDPVEQVHVIFMTQCGPSYAIPIRRDIKTLIYSALV
jgi:CubicO group peptidase (beta-lactamase class C family)